VKETREQMKQRFKENVKQAYTPEEMLELALDRERRQSLTFKFENGFIVSAAHMHECGEKFIRFCFTIHNRPKVKELMEGDASAGNWAMELVLDWVPQPTAIRHYVMGPVFVIEVQPSPDDQISLST